MKLPRWLVIAMLTTSVLSVLAAAGWWWVTWPERTAREFCDLVHQERWDDAAAMCVDGSFSKPEGQDTQEMWRIIRLGPESPRRLSDTLLGRRYFFVASEFAKEPAVVIAERGNISIVDSDVDWGEYVSP